MNNDFQHKKQKILNDLLDGLEVSSMDAFKRYRVMRLSDHVYELRKEGYPIDDRWERSKNTSYKVYFIELSENAFIA